MNIAELTKVDRITGENILLDDTLRPVWKFVFYNGILADSFPQKTQKWPFYVTRFTVTVLIVLLLLVYTIFLLIQLLFSFSLELIVLDKVMITYSFTLLSSGVFCQYYYLRRQKELFQFLNDWKEIETQYLTNCNDTKKKIVIIAYGVYLILLISIAIVTFYWNLTDPHFQIFYSSYLSISESCNIHFIGLTAASSLYYAQLYNLLGEIVPALFFYHVGCVIEGLQIEFQDIAFNSGVSDRALVSNLHIQFRNERPFRRIWTKYETIFHFVKRGNQLFQSVILCHDFTGFMFICLGIYSGFKVSDWSLSVSFFAIVCLIMLRAIGVNWLTSYPYLSREQFETAIANFLNLKWDSLLDEDRQFLVSFQERLNNENLAAQPFNLYTINPSNLLSMLSIIATYVIVLLQINVSTTNL